MAKAQNSVREFATIGFLLLAVLFGMQIMVFVFGNMSAINVLEDVSQAVINETNAHANTTGYTVSQVSQSNFSSGVTITAVWNQTGSSAGYNLTVPLTNVSVTSAGLLTNGTIITYSNISISYTSQHKTNAEMRGDEINNDSLNAIGNYSTQAGTQFTTLGIAITLILLVAVFLFFWVAFMGKGKKGDSSPGGFS